MSFASYHRDEKGSERRCAQSKEVHRGILTLHRRPRSRQHHSSRSAEQIATVVKPGEDEATRDDTVGHQPD
jgi:hypothetical protein